MRLNPWHFVALLVFVSLSAWAQTGRETSYVGEGECKSCHKSQQRSYLAGKHGKIFSLDPRNELEAKGCEACHGPGSSHLQVAGELDYSGPLFINSFKEPQAAGETDKVCLGCHQAGERMHWRSSGHAAQGVACAGCHKIHSEAPASSMDACLGCHKTQRAKLQRSSHMPLRERRMNCMDCHDPHGGIGPVALKAATVSETCYRCHADKRGPNIFEHPPVRENCANCHDPHGSNNAMLLKKRLPYLCQECHLIRGHQSALYDGANLGNAANRHLRGKSCINCHSFIHGSNHPSGARYQR